MATIAVFSAKGGVGKTSIAVNLAWAAASLSRRRTLLWDLDAQAAASFILAPDGASGNDARAVIQREITPDALIVRTGIDGLDLLPADASLRSLDLLLADVGRKKRLLRIGETLARTYDRVIVDCPPGLGLTADYVIRSASLIVLPMIPSILAMRAADALTRHLETMRKRTTGIMPVFNLVDRRRRSHRDALAAVPAQPVIPSAAAIEQMAERHRPIGLFAPRSAACRAVDAIWEDVERRLAAPPRTGVSA